MVRRPVWLVIKHTSGTYDQNFITVHTVASLLMQDALSYERAGLSSTIAADASYSPVEVPWDSVTIFYTLRFETSLFFAPSSRRATVKVFDPDSTLNCSTLHSVFFTAVPICACTFLRQSFANRVENSFSKVPVYTLKGKIRLRFARKVCLCISCRVNAFTIVTQTKMHTPLLL
jgi:hypothetical protein